MLGLSHTFTPEQLKSNISPSQDSDTQNGLYLVLSAADGVNGHSQENKEKDEEWKLAIPIESPGPYLTLQEYKALYDKALFDVNLQGHVLRKYKSGTAEVYGEALPELVGYLIDHLGITASDVVYDIGSGIGNVVLQISAQTGCKSYGVEIREDLHKIATNIHSCLKTEMGNNKKTGLGEVILINGDALNQPNLLIDTTIVFLNNVCYPEHMLHQLEHFFMETLQHGTRVVTVKELFPRTRPTSGARFEKSFAKLFDYPCKQYTTGPGVVSWKAGGVTLNVYTVNRFNTSTFENSSHTEKISVDLKPVKKKNIYTPLDSLVGGMRFYKKVDEYLETLRDNSKLYNLVMLVDSDNKNINLDEELSLKSDLVPFFTVTHKVKDTPSQVYQKVDREYRYVIRGNAKKVREERLEKQNQVLHATQKLKFTEEQTKQLKENIEQYKRLIEENEAQLKLLEDDRDQLQLNYVHCASNFTKDQLKSLVPDFDHDAYLPAKGLENPKKRKKRPKSRQEKMDFDEFDDDEDYDQENVEYKPYQGRKKAKRVEGSQQKRPPKKRIDIKNEHVETTVV